MNQHTVISSAILAVAIVAAAWLMKPVPAPPVPCYEYVRATTDAAGGTVKAYVVDRCSGKVWDMNAALGWLSEFDVQSFK